MAELPLAAAALFIASGEVIRIGHKLKRIISERRNYIDDAEKLRIRLEGSLAKYDAMHRILWAGEAQNRLFNCLDERARLNVSEAIETLKSRVAEDCEALEGRYAIGSVSQDLRIDQLTLQRDQATSTNRPQDRGHRVAVLWAIAGKKRVIRAVEDFSIWNGIIYDHVGVCLLERENQARIGTLRLQAIERSPEGQSCGLSGDITLNRVAHTAPDSAELAKAAQNLQIDEHAITDRGTVAHLHIGLFQNRVVLLERTEELDSSSASASAASDTHAARASQLALLLNSASTSADLRTFKCIGLVTHPAGFDLVFEPPPALELTPSSLLRHIEARQRRRPSLSARLRLAHALAAAVARLHAVGWVHKGLQSGKILLFPRRAGAGAAEAGGELLEEGAAFVFGFEYSRAETSVSALTRREEMAANLYRHPTRWGCPTASFTKNFDIYALGVILFEVGAWVSAAAQVGGVERYLGEARGLRDALLGLADKNLASRAGDKYAEIVSRCLRDLLGDGEELDRALAEVVSTLDTLANTI